MLGLEIMYNNKSNEQYVTSKGTLYEKIKETWRRVK
jgi:hypothetical protein